MASGGYGKSRLGKSPTQPAQSPGKIQCKQESTRPVSTMNLRESGEEKKMSAFGEMVHETESAINTLMDEITGFGDVIENILAPNTPDVKELVGTPARAITNLERWLEDQHAKITSMIRRMRDYRERVRL